MSRHTAKDVVLRRSVLAALIVYLGLTLFAGLDVAAAKDPRFATLVPTPVARNALRAKAKSLWSLGSKKDALEMARDSVAADPSIAANLSTFGNLALLSGDPATALKGFRAAAQFGWRDLDTQIFWWDTAARIGDLQVAAQRADAILRMYPNLPIRDDLLKPVVRSNEGRDAVAERLTHNPSWLTKYLSDAEQVKGEGVILRYDLLMRSSRQGFSAGCKNANYLIGPLLKLGQSVEAGQLWAHHCPDARGSVALSNGGFEQPELDQSLQFRWIYPPSSDVDTIIVPVTGGKALQVENDARVPRVFLQQFLRVAPGSYRVSMDVARPDHSGTVPALGINAVCATGALVTGTPFPDATAGKQTARLTIDPSCRVAQLIIVAPPGIGLFLLDNIEIAPSS